MSSFPPSLVGTMNGGWCGIVCYWNKRWSRCLSPTTTYLFLTKLCWIDNFPSFDISQSHFPFSVESKSILAFALNKSPLPAFPALFSWSTNNPFRFRGVSSRLFTPPSSLTSFPHSRVNVFVCEAPPAHETRCGDY